MKKIFALALAIVMMMAIALPVFADFSAVDADELAQTHFSGTVPADETYTNFDNMYIKYGVQQEYIVTIPADVTFSLADINDETNLFEISRNVSATGIVISGNEVFAVSFVSDKTWKMVDLDGGKSTPVDYNAILADDPMTKANTADSITYNKNTNAKHHSFFCYVVTLYYRRKQVQLIIFKASHICKFTCIDTKYRFIAFGRYFSSIYKRAVTTDRDYNITSF